MKALLSIVYIVLTISFSTNSFAFSFTRNPQKRIFKLIKKNNSQKLNSLLSSDHDLLNFRHPRKNVSPVLYALNKKSFHALKVLLDHGGYNNLKSDSAKIWEVPLRNQDWKSLDVLLAFFEWLPRGSQVLIKQEEKIFKQAWSVISEESKVQLEKLFGYETVGTNLRSKNEEIILEHINAGNYQSYQEFLLKTKSSILFFAIDHSFVELARVAIQQGSPLNQQINGLSSLQRAMLVKEDEIAVLLILNGANVHQGVQIGKYHKSFLHQSIDQKSYRVSKALISMGANLEEKNSEGFTARQIINAQNIYVLSAYLLQKKVLDRLQSILYHQLPQLNLESYASPEAKIHFYKLFEGYEHLKRGYHGEDLSEDFCPICFDPLENTAVHYCMNEQCKFGDSTFKICSSCLKDSLKIQVKDFAYPLHCDHCGVEQIFSRGEIDQLGLQEHAEDIELQTYLAYFKAMFPTAKNCSTPNCTNLIRVEDCDREEHYSCVCGYSYCFKCGENHRGVDCKTHEANKNFISQNPLGKAMHDPASDLRPCPYCYKPFMKDDKCNYVTCPHCKNKWDFIKGKWKYGNDHNYRTDGFNENWKKGKRTYRIPGDINSKTGKTYTAYTEGIYD